MDKGTRSAFRIAKIVVIVGWLAALSAWAIPTEALWAEALRVLVFVLLGIHAVEGLMLVPVFRRAGGPLGQHLALTLIFGIVHYGEVRAELSAREASP
jgi:uncharacterized protein YhhL (DUF1145 family)